MICRTVAFNPHQVATGLPWITYRQINEETSNTNLGLALIAMTRQHLNDSHFEITVGSTFRLFDVRHAAGLSEMQKITQCLHASAGSTGHHYIGRAKRGEHLHALLGAG